MNRRSQEGRWQIDRSLNSAQSFPMGRSAGLRPRPVDESKSATANSCVATKPSRPRRKLSISLPMGRSMGVPVYQNSSLLRPSALLVY
ncbi:hypothetical protein [Leptospira noguchii]|uniref:hypothetical protein n=1 Tax=Leptospira noguchii TaxID=28182 RepID=UPI001FB6DF8D|nr:hypothetical protein [Leptospira noguchii]UOG51702.1 hypothetical protein MAL09_13540 [Leptospira noguchii]